jgi:putative PIN family toxin of toxin-antitoxin system
MRVVIDTNVFVGACIGVGACNAVVRACMLGQLTPLMGAPLLTEYESIMSREHLFINSRLDGLERDRLLDIFVGLCEWTRVYYLWRPNLPDESDNHLIELAVAGGAAFIVTRNLRDLQAGQLQWPNLQMVSPEDFLKEL